MFKHRDICSMLPVLSWRNFSGEFPHLAKTEPGSSNTCSKALRCSKFASSAGSLRSVEVNDIYFCVLGEEKDEKPDHRVLKTPGAAWGQKPHHKLCLRLVLSITEPRTPWFCCLSLSEFPHMPPLHQLPSPGALSKFWGDPKGFPATRKWFKFGELCLICIVYHTDRKRCWLC